MRTKEGGRKSERQTVKCCERKDLVKNKQTNRNLTLKAASSQRQALKLAWIEKKLYETKKCWSCGWRGESGVNTVFTANVRRQKIWGNN